MVNNPAKTQEDIVTEIFNELEKMEGEPTEEKVKELKLLSKRYQNSPETIQVITKRLTGLSPEKTQQVLKNSLYLEDTQTFLRNSSTFATNLMQTYARNDPDLKAFRSKLKEREKIFTKGTPEQTKEAMKEVGLTSRMIETMNAIYVHLEKIEEKLPEGLPNFFTLEEYRKEKTAAIFRFSSFAPYIPEDLKKIGAFQKSLVFSLKQNPSQEEYKASYYAFLASKIGKDFKADPDVIKSPAKPKPDMLPWYKRTGKFLGDILYTISSIITRERISSVSTSLISKMTGGKSKQPITSTEEENQEEILSTPQKEEESKQDECPTQQPQHTTRQEPKIAEHRKTSPTP